MENVNVTVALDPLICFESTTYELLGSSFGVIATMTAFRSPSSSLAETVRRKVLPSATVQDGLHVTESIFGECSTGASLTVKVV